MPVLAPAQRLAAAGYRPGPPHRGDAAQRGGLQARGLWPAAFLRVRDEGGHLGRLGPATPCWAMTVGAVRRPQCHWPRPDMRAWWPKLPGPMGLADAGPSPPPHHSSLQGAMAPDPGPRHGSLACCSCLVGIESRPATAPPENRGLSGLLNPCRGCLSPAALFPVALRLSAGVPGPGGLLAEKWDLPGQASPSTRSPPSGCLLASGLQLRLCRAAVSIRVGFGRLDKRPCGITAAEQAGPGSGVTGPEALSMLVNRCRLSGPENLLLLGWRRAPRPSLALTPAIPNRGLVGCPPAVRRVPKPPPFLERAFP